MKFVNPGSCCLLALLMIYVFLRVQGPDWHEMPVRGGAEASLWLETEADYLLKLSCWWLAWHLAQGNSGRPQCGGCSCVHGPLTSSHHASLVASERTKRICPRPGVIPASDRDRVHRQAPGPDPKNLCPAGSKRQNKLLSQVYPHTYVLRWRGHPCLHGSFRVQLCLWSLPDPVRTCDPWGLQSLWPWLWSAALECHRMLQSLTEVPWARQPVFSVQVLLEG